MPVLKNLIYLGSAVAAVNIFVILFVVVVRVFLTAVVVSVIVA